LTGFERRSKRWRWLVTVSTMRPALAHATVRIAMGAAGSDVALETADIALMGDELGKLPAVIGLSRKASAIIRQNLYISLGMVAFLVPATLARLVGIGPAVVFHEGSTLIVVANALRLLTYGSRGSAIAETVRLD
jgi:Cd2+/Zn2+-exporting ATPase